MQIDIQYPVTVCLTNETPVTELSILQKCLGRKDESAELHQYLSEELRDLGIMSGAVELILDTPSGKLRSKVSYLSPTKLTKAQLERLVDETNDQMTDGYGEEPWELNIDSDSYIIYLCLGAPEVPLSVLQIESATKVRKKRRSPIISAIKQHDRDKIRKYYQAKHLEQTDPEASNPLSCAVYEGLFDIAIEMVEAGATIPENHSLLAYCAQIQKGDLPHQLALAELLLDKGLDINGKSGTYTALMWAANRGNLPLVDFLIKRGADLDQQGENGYTALILAQVKTRDIIRSLLDAGANPSVLTNQNKNAAEYYLWAASAYEDARWPGDLEKARSYRDTAAFIRTYMK